MTVYAQTFQKVANNPIVAPIINKIFDVIVIPAVEILFLIAIFIFIWGVFKLISNAGDSGAREEGKNTIIWSVVGMFIMVSVYGIIRLIAFTLGLNDPFL